MANHASEIVLDVREDLRAGREPFQKIMRAAEQVPGGGSLVIYATFKPTPLIAVLKSMGFDGVASPIDGGDWKVVFHKVASENGEPGDFTPLEVLRDAGSQAADDIILDNRGLEPPMPMARTLEAINRLQPGQRIVGHFDRRPMFLLPKLDAMGFTYQISPQQDGSAIVVIQHGLG